MWKRALGVGVAALATLGATVGVRAGAPEPHFDVIQRIGDVEIRRYGERIAAETEVVGGDEQGRYEGFRRLAGYIFGANAKSASIEMTAPVQQTPERIAMTAAVAQVAAGAGAWRIQFFMPAQYRQISDLPAPKDPAVRLQVIPAMTYAVLRFSGSRDGDAMRAKQRELLATLAPSAWRSLGEPINWFYDPPWTLPMFRRNEVAVEVTRAPRPPAAGAGPR